MGWRLDVHCALLANTWQPITLIAVTYKGRRRVSVTSLMDSVVITQNLRDGKRIMPPFTAVGANFFTFVVENMRSLCYRGFFVFFLGYKIYSSTKMEGFFSAFVEDGSCLIVISGWEVRTPFFFFTKPLPQHLFAWKKMCPL